MTDSLDNILARKAEAAPQEQPTEQVTQEQEAPDTTPEASADTPAQETAPEGQQTTKMVPHEALHAEKQKVKRYTEQVAEFQKLNEGLSKQVGELLQRFSVQQQAQQPQPDWYVEPNVAFQQSFQQSIDPVLTPMKQQLQMVTGLLHKMQAKSVMGDQYDSFLDYVKENANDPEVIALGAAMESSPDPFTYAKQWYDKKTFDPEAERERIREEERQKILSGNQSQQTQSPPSVMPTNLTGARNVGSRSGPTWAGPPTLNDIFKR